MVEVKDLVEELKKLARKILTLQFVEGFNSSSQSKQIRKEAGEEALRIIDKLIEKIKEEGLYLPEPRHFKEKLKFFFKRKVQSVSFKKRERPKNKDGQSNKSLLIEKILALI